MWLWLPHRCVVVRLWLGCGCESCVQLSWAVLYAKPQHNCLQNILHFWCTSTRHLKAMHFYSLAPRLSCVHMLLQVTESWVGPGNEASSLSVVDCGHSCDYSEWCDLLFGAMDLLGCIGNESLSCGGTHLLCRMSNRLLDFAGTTVIFNSMLLALDKCKLPQVPKQQGKSEKLSLNWKWLCRSNTKAVGGRDWCMWVGRSPNEESI